MLDLVGTLAGRHSLLRQRIARTDGDTALRWSGCMTALLECVGFVREYVSPYRYWLWRGCVREPRASLKPQHQTLKIRRLSDSEPTDSFPSSQTRHFCNTLILYSQVSEKMSVNGSSELHNDTIEDTIEAFSQPSFTPKSKKIKR